MTFEETTLQYRKTELTDWAERSWEQQHIIDGRSVFLTGKMVPGDNGQLVEQVVVSGGDGKLPDFRPRILEGTTYFVGPEGGPIKIGFASRLEYRLKDLRTMNAYPLVVHAKVFGPLTLERAYHARFAAHRLHGEWFAPHPDILAEIERLNG